MFKELQETSKTLLRVSLVTSLFFGLLGGVLLNDNAAYASNIDYVALVGGKIPFLTGLLLGTVLTFVKIILIDRSCRKALDMEVAMGKLYGTGQYFLRFMLTAVVLLFAMLVSWVGFLGCVLGVFTLQIGGYITPFLEKKKTLL